ncbi:hypothetical protein KY309_01955 [Candidatus Woesearchaeota archaeon]|nr:hypothetical protein [Candidatus Woesearchaeota archaeon]MBW3016351.1 hypothetical protein [Candidatus Woesearchaeota archaeon]
MDNSMIRDYVEFCDALVKAESLHLAGGEGVTNRSRLEHPFLEVYLELASRFGKPSVTEFGGAVPPASLFLLSRKYLDKVVVVDNDASVLSRLEVISKGLELPVEVVNADINRMSSFPDTDVAVSFNCLYGESPNFANALSPPYLKRPVVSEASYRGFGVFRSAVNGKWKEKAKVVRQMKNKYVNSRSDSLVVSDMRNGFIRKDGRLHPVADLVQFSLFYVVGWS